MQQQHLHIILPTQLFNPPSKYHPLSNNSNIYVCLVEEKLYFTEMPFHKMKLVFHRASMKEYLKNLPQHTRYFEFHVDERDIVSEKYTRITMIEPHDYLVLRKWQTLCGDRLEILPSPLFLIDYREVDVLHRHDQFYKMMRKKLNILMESPTLPVGKKFSFDTDNRKKYPRTSSPPSLPPTSSNPLVYEAEEYVLKNFPKNPGLTQAFIYPINHIEATRWLTQFCEHRLQYFGEFQDSLSPHEHPFVFHSVLSPLLNVGLLLDKEVLQEVLKYYGKVPLASLEGFIRQLIGWRQYVMCVYHKHYDKLRIVNTLNHHRDIPRAFWEMNTGFPPVDAVLEKVHRWGYCHHIERLMVLGNFLLLCHCHPQKVSDWFQSFVAMDAYEIFMLTNVKCMSQFADGGSLMMKRPYVSGSSYIRKMSHYSTKNYPLVVSKYLWTVVWDALFYSFINHHQHLLEKNYSMAAHVSRWRKMPKDKQIKTLKIAEEYLVYIHR